MGLHPHLDHWLRRCVLAELRDRILSGILEACNEIIEIPDEGLALS